MIASDEKMQTLVIQIRQIIMKTDYFELLSMLPALTHSSVPPWNVQDKPEVTQRSHWNAADIWVTVP